MSRRSLSELPTKPLQDGVSEKARYCQGGSNVREAALGASVAGVTEEVNKTRERPDTTEGSSGDGVLDTSDEESAEERSQVLSEVGVRTLGC